MCVQLMMPDGEWIDTMGGARRVFPILVAAGWHPTAADLQSKDEMCICALDIGATATANGYSAEREDWGDWVLTRALEKEAGR